MKRTTTILTLTLLAIMTVTTAAIANPISLNFDGGMSSTAVDAYPGVAGSGWDSEWQYYDAGGTATITVNTTDPLSTGSGAYLDVISTGNYHTISRNYGNTDTFDPLSDHTISWQFRLNDDFVFDDIGDRIHFFGDSSRDESTDSSDTWCIGVAPEYMGFSNFYFYNPTVDNTFIPENVVNTGMALEVGTTYSFSVSVHPLQGTYDATISNGQFSYSRTGLGYRNGSTMSDASWLNFGGTNNGGSAATLSYSIDSVEITGGSADVPMPRADGFKGIWYYNQEIGGDYVYKYSGGFAVYPQQIRPMAQYSAEADKTFFVYGGTNSSNSTIYHCISYYDHQTGQVAQPRVLMDKGTTDAHDNPCMVIDDEGYIFIFSNSHGTGRPSYINRSTEPYSIDEFETVLELPGSNNFSYGQPLYVEGQGFMFLHTLYTSTGRTLCFNTSSDGINWDYDWENRPKIAQMPTGQYQVSQVSGQTVGTAFNYHPGGNVNARTNLYYMETNDMGQTWTTADGTLLTTPVTTVSNAALVHDYAAENLLVYMKDIQYDADGQPVIMYMTSNGWESGPEGDPRMLHVAHYDEGSWVIKDLFLSDHNYDYGQLTIEDDGTWRIIAPTDPGPQVYATGGEMVMWVSEDEGYTWSAIRDLTYDSEYNHTYAKQPVDANDEFYAIWADGNAYAPSESCLYFTDKNGTGVWRLPYDMDTDFATPELAYTPIVNAIPGDANEDGVVDGSDVTILAANWQYGVNMENPDATWWMGDFNGDGVVDGSDVTILAGNWQYGVDAGSASVPEPGTLALLCWLLLMVAAYRKKH